MTDKVPGPLQGISLFSGAGGMDIGLEAAGFNALLSLELDGNAAATLRANRPDWNVADDGDVVSAATRFDPSDFSLERGELDLISGGPPCQPFSSAAQWASSGRLGMQDLRADTVHGLLDMVERFLPRAVLLENVKGFVAGQNAALPAIEQRLATINRRDKTNYRVEWKVLNAADFGVPQNRRRAIVVILQDGKPFEWPAPTHENDPITSWDALAELKEEDLPSATGKWTALLPSIPEGFNYQWLTSEGGGPELFGYRTKFWNFLLKLDRGQPSWTLPASPGPSTGPFHWENRPLSPNEMLRLQSFPVTWQLTGDRRQQTRLAGNATPPLLMEVMGRALMQHLTGEQNTRESLPTLTIRHSKKSKARLPLAPLPASFEHLIGTKPQHAGAGKGPAPRSPATTVSLAIESTETVRTT